jgi:uncharacterized Zn finger protein (UPF0148 family)
MTILIVLAVVALALFVFQKKFKNLILNKKKKPEVLQEKVFFKKDADVFCPTGTVRTFSVNFEIQEQGDGSAIISIAKQKPEVKTEKKVVEVLPEEMDEKKVEENLIDKLLEHRQKTTKKLKVNSI